MIELKGVSKVFAGEVTALDAIELEVAPGEMVMVVGPSGSGKSTLLFTIGAMLAPTDGQVLLGGTDVYRLSARRRAALRRRRVGFMFQTFNLVPYLSCVDNVALPSTLDGRSRRASVTSAVGMLERLGLGDRLRHRPAELSVGERQRVALCRSLINDPEVLLADEPTGNLDDDLTDEVMALLTEANDNGQTILMATHDRRLASMGTRVVGLEQGFIVADHAPTQDKPTEGQPRRHQPGGHEAEKRQPRRRKRRDGRRSRRRHADRVDRDRERAG